MPTSMARPWKLKFRQDFGYFRQRIRPGMLWGWWNEVIATELAQFLQGLRRGQAAEDGDLHPAAARQELDGGRFHRLGVRATIPISR